MALSHPSYTVDTTFSSKNISSAASVYTFTAAADALVYFTVKLTNAAGNGDYVVYLKHQWLGAGTAAVVLPKTTAAAASGETVIEFVTVAIAVKNTDVLDVFIDGLAGDTSVNGNIRIAADNPSVFAAGTDSVTISAASVDAVWDEVLTGATHNVTNSAGKRLRQVAGNVVHDGTAQGAGVDSNQIQLDAGASSTNGAYDPSVIAITGGTGIGQCRLILQYDGTTKTATVDRNWRTNPDATSEFVIYAHPGREHVNEGLAQAGGASTITLNANASPFNNAYVGQIVFIRSGMGQDQVRLVSAYNGTTKVATLTEAWDTQPDTTSAYVMLPAHVHEISEIVDGVWDEPVSGHLTPGTTGEYLDNAGGGSVVVNATVAVSETTALAVASGTLAVQTHYTLAQTVTSTMTQDLSAATKLWLAVKSKASDDDDEAVIFIEKTDGLTVLDGAAYTTTTDGSLSVSGSSGDWDVTIGMEEDATALLDDFSGQSLYAELKALIGGDALSVWSGRCVFNAGIVQAVS